MVQDSVYPFEEGERQLPKIFETIGSTVTGTFVWYGWPSYSELIILTTVKLFCTHVEIIFIAVKMKHWPLLLRIKLFLL